VSAGDLVCAREFLAVLAEASRTGDRDAIYELLAPDVEWLTPKRDVRGIDAAREELTWIRPPDNLDIEFDEPDLNDLGDGRIVSEVRETYRVKGSGDYAYERARRIELTIRDGKVARYEMRMVG
jgi:ketosteroid isomerase-like protein